MLMKNECVDNELIAMENVDLSQTKEEMELKLKSSEEVKNIVRSIDVKDVNSIMKFGGGATDKISTFSDTILKDLDISKMDKANEIVTQLNKIMTKFDIEDFNESEINKKESLFNKLFNSAKNKMEKLLSKYNTMGSEIEKIYVCLKEVEYDMTESNKHLDAMFNQNIMYYEQLKKYIVAGEMALEELDNEFLPQLEMKCNTSGDSLDKVQYNHMNQVREIIAQRVHDLRLAENVALQSLPSIRLIQYGNYNLLRKINSAFIVTLPTFKQCIIQAIEIKRQAIPAKGLAKLDEKTNEILLKNANNIALQTKAVAKLSSGSFVNVETLEKSWTTIMDGIQGAKAIQDEMKSKRVEDRKRLEILKQQIKDTSNS